MDLLLAFILAMALTVALIPALMRRAAALHVLDAARPSARCTSARCRASAASRWRSAWRLPLLLWLDLDRLTAAYAGRRR